MNCYISNPKNGATLPPNINKDNTLFYPENGMTTSELFTTTIPENFHIVTDNPFLVPLYKKEEVFIWKDNEWVHPDFQTYGSAYQYVIRRIFGGYEMPRAVLNGTITNCMGNPIKQPK